MTITKWKRSLIFMMLVITLVLCSMLSTALTTALPSIMTDFGINSATAQWLTSVYSLVMGILVLCTAYLIRRFPTKPLYISSLVIFTIGILLNAITNSFAVMMIGRVLQAAGNGILMSLGQVIILTIYPKEQHGSVMGIYGLASGAAPIVAPTLAGIVVDLWGWRMIFYILLGICAIALITAFAVMDNVLEVEKGSFDFISALLCAVGFGGVLFGVGKIGSQPFFSLQLGLPLIIGMICCVLFSVRQLKGDTPFLDLRVLANRKLRIAVIGSVLFYFNMMALAVINPIFIQTACGYTATECGLFMMPGSIIMALLSPVMGKAYDKLGINKLFIVGAVLLTVGTFGSGWCGGIMAVFIIFNILRSVAISMLMMPLLTWGVSGLAKSEIAAGQALVTSLRTIAGAFGSAIFMAMESALASGMELMGAMKITYAAIAAVGIAELILAFITCHRKAK